MLAKNKFDSLVHTREVVDEIKHLTKMLNFKNEAKEKEGSQIWNNINWGENAPYWNQYYKIVREYKYPFEVIFSSYLQDEDLYFLLVGALFRLLRCDDRFVKTNLLPFGSD